MIIIECIKMAISSIVSNKTRSFLTMLGIIIGISAVILITCIGDSLSNALDGVFNEMGINHLIIGMEEKTSIGDSVPLNEEDKLNEEMLKELERTYPDEYSVMSSEYLGSGKAIDKNNNYINVEINGANSAYFEYTRTKIKKGRTINDRDCDENRYSIVVSEQFEKKYGNDEGIIGKPVNISVNTGEELTFYVVGVYKDSKNQGGVKDPIDVYIPVSVVRSMLNIQNKSFEMAIVVWNKEYKTSDHTEHAWKFFDKQYKSNENWTVYIDDMNEFTGIINTIMNIVTVAFTIIAAISLLVGGIGVMNIMLVSVVERTREIGIRKAIGARKSAILFQFVTEAIIICLIGGILGILIGVGLSLLTGVVAKYAISLFFAQQSGSINLVITPTLKPILIALITSTAVGVIFGYYPAKNAAKLNPLDALRHDG